MSDEPKRPGIQYVSYAELEEFAERLLKSLPTYNPSFADAVRIQVARVFNEMVREKKEGAP